MGSDVWIRDLLLALPLAQGRGEEAERAIARLLGFDITAPGAGRQDAAPGNAVFSAAEDADLPGLLPEEPSRDALASHPRTPDLMANGPSGEDNSLSLLDPCGEEAPLPFEWTVPSLPPPDQSRLRAPLPYESLLAPRSTSALLHLALSRQVDQGELDVERVVDQLSRGLPLESLPRCPIRTVRFGVQVLADLGVNMEPFSRDVHETVQNVQATVGHEHTQVAYFDHCPVRGAGPGPRWTWGEYVPPAPGTRILILSDLGMGGPRLNARRSTRAEWERLIRILAYAECTAVAFVPFPEQRWPSWAAKLLPLVPWDRQTTAGWVATHIG
jgi:hypothetical protein